MTRNLPSGGVVLTTCVIVYPSQVCGRKLAVLRSRNRHVKVGGRDSSPQVVVDEASVAEDDWEDAHADVLEGLRPRQDSRLILSRASVDEQNEDPLRVPPARRSLKHLKQQELGGSRPRQRTVFGMDFCRQI